MLFDAQGAIFVAEIEGGDSSVVAGFVRIVDVQSPGRGALRPRRFALVDDLVVDPAFRRSGLGTRLLQTAEAWARERGVEALEVTVWAFNQAAQDLYTIPRQDLRGPRKFLRPVRANGVGAPFAGCRGEALTVDTGEAGAACSCGASVARPVRSI
jgi:GNAT superfamily N-acetyltransferase